MLQIPVNWSDTYQLWGKEKRKKKNLPLCRVQGRGGNLLERPLLLLPVGFLDFSFLFLSFGAHSGPHGSCCCQHKAEHLVNIKTCYTSSHDLKWTILGHTGNRSMPKAPWLFFPTTFHKILPHFSSCHHIQYIKRTHWDNNRDDQRRK